MDILDINTLKVGDELVYTTDGRANTVTVQSAPEKFGAYDSRTVKVGFGPGRWNTSVSNDGQKNEFYRLRRA